MRVRTRRIHWPDNLLFNSRTKPNVDVPRKTGQEDEIPSKEGCLHSEFRDGYSALWPRTRFLLEFEGRRSTTRWKPEKVRLKEGKKG